MSSDDVYVSFLGGPLHGKHKFLPLACDTFFHEEGMPWQTTYRRAIWWSHLSINRIANESSAVFLSDTPPASGLAVAED